MYEFYYPHRNSRGRCGLKKANELSPDRNFKLWQIRVCLKWILLWLAIIPVSISANAQENNLPKISISRKNATLTEVLKEIKKQSGYGFVISEEMVKKSTLITLKMKDASIEEILKSCAENQPFAYEIKNGIISIREKMDPFTNQPVKYIYLIHMHCRIMDDIGLPLPGATVKVKGQNRGEISDRNGEFDFSDLEDDAILQISYIGYKSMDIKASEKVTEIKLASEHSRLDEVQVVAYGTTTARKSTGNVVTITAADIAKQPVSDVLQSLQGRIPGMVVKPTSGYFSGNYSVKIRGNNTIPLNGVNAVSDPLYVIDGVPLTIGSGDQRGYGTNQNGLRGPAEGQNPLLYLNPSDIESISVLKDADATALYGSRGANGVILITTKKAKQGKTQVDVSFFTGYSQQSKKLKLMNTPKYVAMRREALSNEGLTPDAENAYDLVVWDTTRNVDWQKQLLRTAKTTDAQLGFSGGDAKTSFRLNAGYHQETPPFPGDFSERRASTLFNISHSEFDQKLKTTLILNYSNTNSNLPRTDPTGLVLLAPNAPDIYTPEGKLNYAGWKPGSFPRSFTALEQPYKANTNNLSTNIVVDYNFLQGFNFNVSGGYSLMRQDQTELLPASSQNPSQAINRTAKFGENNLKTWLLEPSISWSLPFKNSHLKTLIGSTFQESIIDGNQIELYGFVNDSQLEDRGAAAGYYFSASNYSQTRIQSLFGRISYNVLGKYIINVNLRRDGSSRFGPGNQFGNFGSVGAAWIFSEEPFMKNGMPFISFGKLNGSYGSTGGDQIGDYAYISSYRPGYTAYQGNPVLELENAYNPNYKWAVNKKLDLSLTLGFFKDRILFTSSFYQNRAGNQLAQYSLPRSTGFTSVVDNIPALVQNKGYEFQLVTKNIQGQKFNWNTAANISFTKNKLLAYPGLEGSSNAGLLTIGQPIARTALFHYLGMKKETGEYLFEDKDKNGSIDYEIDQDFYQTDPSFTGGIENDMQYGNFSLSLFFSFTKQKGFLNAYNYIPGALEANQLTTVQDHWQKPGDVAKFTRYTMYGGDDINLYASSDALWVDASYIRLQSASVSYYLPASFWGKAHLPTTRISLQGQNLLTFTRYEGADPTNPGTSVTLPSRRFITAKIQFSF